MINLIPRNLLVYAVILFSNLFSLTVSANSKLDSLRSIRPKSTEEKFYNYVMISYQFRRAEVKYRKMYLDSATMLMASGVKESKLVSYYTSYGEYYYIKSRFDSAMIMYKLSASYVGENHIMLLGQASNNIGLVYSKQDNYDSSLYYYNRALSFYNRADSSYNLLKVKHLKANIFNNIGTLYLNVGMYDKSVTYYYKAMDLYEQEINSKRTAHVLMNIANIFLYHSEYEKALFEYKRALGILEKYKSKRISSRANLYTNMGICYKGINQLDTAMSYYEKALKIRKRIGPETSVAGLYDNIGNLKKSQGEYALALSYYQRALDIRKNGSSPRWLASSFGNIGLLYAEMKQNRKAINYLTKAVDIAEDNRLVEISLECKRGLSEAYRNSGNYKKAFNFYVEYQELNDSIHSLKIEEKLNEYKQKYESEKKDRLIEKLEEEQKMADLKAEKQIVLNEKQNLILKGLGGFAIALVIILILLQRYFAVKRKSDHELYEKNEQLNQQKTLELMKELEMSSFRSFMEGQEKERARIAGDLHDRLGSLLSTVKLHFSSLEETIENNNEAKESYEFALKLLDNSVEEVRAVSHNLSKGVLTQFGLVAAVEHMRDAINASGKINMEVINLGVDSRLDPEVEISLFRVIQELITNVIRHAQTDEVFIQFSEEGTHLGIMVEDRGVGFDKDKVNHSGIGMDNLQKRVQSVGGEYSVDSIIGQGTTIIIDVPYKFEKGKKEE